jgi:hypothetical protein
MASRKNSISLATNEKNKAGNRTELKIGDVVIGEITYVNPENNVCKVMTNYPSQEVDNCVWLTKSFTAPILGYRIKSLPAEGTYVYMLYGNPSFILGVVASPDYDENFSQSVTSEGQFIREEHFADEIYKGADVAASTLEGEFEIENAFNVGMSFLANIVAMKAGERAKVEAHLLQDMIRIIAEKFETITPLGTTSIYNNGRPNMEMTFGSYEHELLNLPTPNQDKVNTSGYHINFDSLETNDPAIEFGHRFKAYVGFLGNFINMFVSDPLRSLNALVSGKAHIHVGNSGEVLIRSTSEVALERVVRIVTPVRLKDKNEISSYMSDKFDKMQDFEMLKKWDYNKNDENSVHTCAYSLRCYARYLSNFASLIRFHQISNGNDPQAPFRVPAEKDLLAPDDNNGEQDLFDANGPQIFEETYSTIRIMKDGAIVTMASDGSCLYQGRGIFEISAPKDVRIEAGRDLSIVVGRHSFIKSKKDIEICSVEGQVSGKSRKDFNVLSEEGKLWLKSDATKEKSEHGIILDSTQNKVLVNSKLDTAFRQEEGDFLITNIKGNLLANICKFIGISSKEGSTLIKSNSKVCLKSDEVFIDTKNLNLANRLKLTGKELLISAKTFFNRGLVSKGTIYGPPVATKQYAIYTDSDGNSQRAPIPGEYNHIKRTSAGTSIKITPGDSGSLLSQEAILKNKLKQLDKQLTMLKWSFSDYELDLPEDGSKDSLFIPLAQDYVETHESEFTDYIVWNFEDDKLKEAPRTDAESKPYPGKKVTKEFYSDFTAGEILDKVSEKESIDWEQPEIKNRPIQRKVNP